MREVHPWLRKSFCLAAVLATACATADPVLKTDFAVAGIREGSDKAAVRKVLGAPPSTGASVWSYPGLDVTFSAADKVSALTITSSRYSTPRGLRPGDSSQRVLVAHGSPYRINGEPYAPKTSSPSNFPPPSSDVSWTYCEPRDPVCEHAIFVSFDAAGRVSSILLGNRSGLP